MRFYRSSELFDLKIFPEGTWRNWQKENEVELEIPGSSGIPSMISRKEVLHFALRKQCIDYGIPRKEAVRLFGKGVKDPDSPFHLPEEDWPELIVIRDKDGRYEADPQPAFGRGDIDIKEDKAAIIINIEKLIVDVDAKLATLG